MVRHGLAWPCSRAWDRGLISSLMRSRRDIKTCEVFSSGSCEPTGFSAGSEQQKNKTESSQVRGKALLSQKHSRLHLWKKTPSPRCRACFCEASHGEEIKRRLALNVPTLECLPSMKNSGGQNRPLTPSANSNFYLLRWREGKKWPSTTEETGKTEMFDTRIRESAGTCVQTQTHY